ncbi:MAG: hypothetical protein M3Z92_00775 [Bacteroidota bacterium]|nr:hypothetical protein [Bacteroidota bacterium]
MNFSNRINYICLVAAIGGLLFGFDTAVISEVISLVKNQFQLSTVSEGWLGSSGLLGALLVCLQPALSATGSAVKKRSSLMS